MNFFVKLSQHKKIMVPVVVVVGLAIFGSSYFIQDRRAEVAHQGNESTPAQSEPQADDLQRLEPAQPQSEVPASDNPDAPVSSDTMSEEGDGVETVRLEIEVEGKTVVVSAATLKPGECTLNAYAKNGNLLLSRTVSTSETNSCNFSNFDTSGAQRLQAQYHSSDQTAKGSGELAL